MLTSTRVRLLEADPDLGSVLTPEELAEARQLAVPVLTIEHEGDLAEFEQPGAFGALVLDGMVLRQLRIDTQLGMRLLGPGDIIPLKESPPPMLVTDSSLRAVPQTRLALLGRELMFAARRWPSLVAALQLRANQQADRLAAQLVICQLPRVDQRLLSLLWLLAESWGRVTPAGTSLPLKLTHEALGALIGARRPTVTLALRELTERGAVIRQSEGWLLLESPPVAPAQEDNLQIPALVENGPSGWARPIAVPKSTAAPVIPPESYAALKESILRLREQHARNRDQVSERLQTAALVREHCRASRRRIAGERLTRQGLRSP